MKQKIEPPFYFYIMLITAFLFRCITAYFYTGFLTDTACFTGWANRIYADGFADFYSPDTFTDYPPGYMYILYVIGALLSKLHIGTLSGSCLLLIKLPAIFCDIASGALVYQISLKRFSAKKALLLGCLYLFNPAVFINSSMWGQVDSVFTLCILLLCLLLTEGKTIAAYFVFALGILLKPQTLVFTPLILFGIYEHVLCKDFHLKKFLINLVSGLAAIACMIVLCLPYGLDKVFAQYVSTLTSYPYISVNAYNFWSMLGLNWSSQEKSFFCFSYAQLGIVIILVLTFLSVLLFLRQQKRPERYFLCGAFLIITMFLFSVRMHERYLFPALLLLLITFIISGCKHCLYTYLLLSAGHFLNMWHVLYHYDPYDYDARSAAILSISLFLVLSGIYFYRIVLTDLNPGKEAEKAAKMPNLTVKTFAVAKKRTGFFQKWIGPQKPAASVSALPFTAADWILMFSVTLFYACFAFYRLGNTAAPKTEYTIPYYSYLEITSADDAQINTLNWYLLKEQDIDFTLEMKNDEEEDWIYVQDFTMKSVFSWGSLKLPSPADSIRITNITKDASVGEIVIQDAKGNILPVQNRFSYPAFYDEADTFPQSLDHLSGCIFDEIYYTRTVYEFLHGLPTYENTHPPFGKILITLGTVIFGMTPWGFRFAGALFGILMLPLLYLLGRNISKSRSIGAFVCFLFAFDFMHFTQTRIATIDVFVTFFIIVMYYFMERYQSLSFYDRPLKETWLPLGACGISFGFAVASKWTGFYAGAGLALIFFAQLLRRYREYQYALQDPDGSTDHISHRHILRVFQKNTCDTIGFCMIFFVLIPFCIYLLSYIPFVDPSHPGLFERMLANQKTMFSYHSNLNATHPYSSSWYEWPTMVRPILYYTKTLEGSLRQGISAFGNPLVWWAGIPAFLYTLYLAICKKRKTAAFLCTGYLAQYLPWLLVSRCTFIYHYFPSVPFLVLMIGYNFLQLKRKIPPKAFLLLLILYAAAAFFLFLLFYPVLSGGTVTYEFVTAFLRWFDSWVLVIR